MTDKPSSNEQEYFARQEAELRRKAADARRAEVEEAERMRLRELHFMKCPKCGMQLEEIGFGDVRVDKCFNCEGIWLDNGELERLQAKDPGFLRRLTGIFRS